MFDSRIGRWFTWAVLAATALGACARTPPRASQAPVVSLQLDPPGASLPIGKTLEVTAQGVRSDGTTVGLLGLQDCQWSLDDSDLLTLESTGAVARLRATRVGSTLLFARALGLTASIRIEVTEAAAVRLAVASDRATLPVAGLAHLTATALYSDDTRRDVTAAATWSISPSDALAPWQGAGPSAGAFVALKPGAATATARWSQLEGSARLEVTGAPLSHLAIQPASATLPLRVPFQFTAVAIYADATALDVTQLAQWSSSKPDALSVSSSAAGLRGVATALSPGDAAVAAQFQGFSSEAKVVMTAALLQSLEVSPAFLELAKGTSAPLAATALFSDGTRVDVTAQASWSSSAPAVAAVPAATPGAVAALSPGAARITASFLGLTASCAVAVSAARLVSVDVSPASLRLPKGASASFTATGTYTDRSTQDLTGQVRWLSSDEAVASVASGGAGAGLASARGVGIASVTAELDGAAGAATLEVTAAEIRGLSVEPATAVLAKGTSLELTAAATFSDGSTLDVTDLAAWVSDRPAVADVSTLGADRGLVTAGSPGLASVTALYANRTAAAQVIVTQAVLRSLEIAPANPVLAKGTRLPMKAVGAYSDGTTQDVTSQATWSSGDPALLAVSNASGSNGVITGLAQGAAMLRATLSGKTASTEVIVSAAAAVGLQLSPSPVELEYQGRQQLTATATFSDGTTQDVTSDAAFSSADPTIAAVVRAGAARGLVTAGRAGETTVTATYASSSAAVKVAVRGPRPVSLEIRPASAALPAGTQLRLAALAHLADGSLTDVTAQATWSSSAEAAAVAAGLVTARALGEATVTAALDGLEAAARITVTAPMPTAVTLTPTAATIAVGDRLPFSARAFFTDSSSRDITAEALFTSSAPAVVGVEGHVAVGVARGGPETVSVWWSGLTAAAQVRVVAASLVSVAVSPDPAVMKKGGTAQLKALAHYSDGSALDVTREARWTSTDPAVVTVDLTSGLASAKGAGVAKIQAAFGGMTGSAEVTVQAPAQTRVAIVPPDAVLHQNLIYPYRAFAVFDDGTSSEVTAAATWLSSSPQVAEPTNQSGFFGVWAHSLGTARIRAGSGGQQGATSVQVIDPTLAGVEVSPAQLALPVGAAAKLSGVFLWSDGWAVQVQNPSWASLDSSVAEVDSNGVVRAKAPGATAVRMTAYDASFAAHTARTTVRVTAAKLTSIAVEVPSALVVGTATRVRALGTFSDGAVLNLGPSAIWSTSDVSIAGVKPGVDGALVQALAKGNAVIGASFGGATGTRSVSVSDAALASIRLNLAQTELPLGGSSPVTVAGQYSDGTSLDLTDAAVFDSSAPDQAIVSDGIFGNAKSPFAVAQAPGQVILRATVGDRTSTAAVAVRGATLSSIALSVNGGAPGSTLTLPGAGPFRLTALGTFSDGSTADVTPFCSFAPGSPGPGVVAAISNSTAGEITVLGRGSEAVGVTYAPFFIGQAPVRASATLVVP